MTSPLYRYLVAPVPSRRFLSRSVTLGMPAVLTVILALVAGGAQVANGIVLVKDPQWQLVATLVITTIAGFGIQPLVGAQFAATLDTLLHLPYWALLAIAGAITVAAGVVQAIPMGHAAHVIILTALTMLNALGFGSSAATALPVPPAPPTPPPPTTGGLIP